MRFSISSDRMIRFPSMEWLAEPFVLISRRISAAGIGDPESVSKFSSKSSQSSPEDTISILGVMKT